MSPLDKFLFSLDMNTLIMLGQVLWVVSMIVLLIAILMIGLRGKSELKFD